MNTENLYPYLVPGAPDPAAAELAVPVGHGFYAVLFDDTEPGVFGHRAVTADQLRAAGLTPAEAHRLALDNLDRFADADPGLSIQVLGDTAGPVHWLLYSDHPRAAACLRLPDLYDHSRELLGADALCACVPQAESLVVFADRGPDHRAGVVAKLREIEADANRPLSFGLFELTAAGVRPIE
ncbi:MAG: hypothetical protein K2X82_23650 [Gemmataceae bacterium]|nr:hypothetical protein [Gemmataceae bacterium]